MSSKVNSRVYKTSCKVSKSPGHSTNHHYLIILNNRTQIMMMIKISKHLNHAQKISILIFMNLITASTKCYILFSKTLYQSNYPQQHNSPVFFLFSNICF
ncbi:hypothetical protein CARUB_v10003459mg [Capsella rubella]|uniref:Uncharacterized protein n=1 Tax=Capsella rubella TaxID=81985 RepID=R0FJW8_9BRAS|nr:hypothetical protein CARUB_v10003459mg [Capsella rubella]